MPIVEFVVGDWSRDGHNQSDKISMETNLSAPKIYPAYKAGTEKLGFDFTEECCTEYEDRRISWEHLQKLRAAGFTSELDDEMTPEESLKINEEWKAKGIGRNSDDSRDLSGACLDTEMFTEIYCFIVKLGNPIFTYKKVSSKSINIGGYGLFGN